MFNQKFPAFAALIVLVATIGKDALAKGETLMQKLTSFSNVAGPAIAFVPQASLLGAELDVLKASPADIELGVEYLLTQGFESDKAKEIMTAAFPVAEKAVGLIPDVQNLIAVIKK